MYFKKNTTYNVDMFMSSTFIALVSPSMATSFSRVINSRFRSCWRRILCVMQFIWLKVISDYSGCKCNALKSLFIFTVSFVTWLTITNIRQALAAESAGRSERVPDRGYFFHDVRSNGWQYGLLL